MSSLLMHGDCLEMLKDLPDDSIDAIVTDPPYGLSFMGKKWDYDVPSIEIWKECLRVLKPGGHVLSFGGTRTYHRMVVNIEDAGFEIRDQVMWIYGSGFPKSHNLKGEHEGFGTALKPANEPICLARKPIIGTVAKNVQEFGTGAINIDASRIVSSDALAGRSRHGGGLMQGASFQMPDSESSMPAGRWPANVLFDEEAAALLGEPSRFFYVAKASKRERNAGLEGMPVKSNDTHNNPSRMVGSSAQKAKSEMDTSGTSGNQNHHPTVKPIKLMEYLVRMITPPGGVILDPFMGSGTTGIAAKKLGFDFIGIEREAEYIAIAEKRIG